MSKKLTNREKQTVIDRWSEHTSDSAELSAAVYWLAVPEVMARYQAKLTDGRYGSWVEMVVGDFLSDRAHLSRILSLGCGDGALERDLARLNAFGRCDAFDLSPTAIAKARQAANAGGFGGRIGYEAADVNTISLEPGLYDSIWFNGSLHHVSALEHVLEQCRLALRPEGYLIAHEYVGPSRFDFTPRQKQAIDAAWRLIPHRFKRWFVGGSAGAVAPHAPCPVPAEVVAADPSEAVRSAEIVEQVRARFDICYERQAGGTILQFLLSGIAGNFRSEDRDSIRVLELLFEIEDVLIEAGDLASDFMLLLGRPRTAGIDDPRPIP